MGLFLFFESEVATCCYLFIIREYLTEIIWTVRSGSYCNDNNKETQIQLELHLQTHLCKFIYYTIYRMAMNTKVFLLAIAIVAAVATFAIATIASSDMLSGLGPTEVFAQNMTNMTGGNMTNMTG